MAECKGRWSPGPVRPDLCRWWIWPPDGLSPEQQWEPYCCHEDRMADRSCPYGGYNPYPQEDDGDG